MCRFVRDSLTLQIFLTNYTDAQFVLGLQSTLPTPCSYFNEYKEAEKKKEEKTERKMKIKERLTVCFVLMVVSVISSMMVFFQVTCI